MSVVCYWTNLTLICSAGVFLNCAHKTLYILVPIFDREFPTLETLDFSSLGIFFPLFFFPIHEILNISWKLPNNLA